MPNGGSDCCGTCWFNPKARARQAQDSNYAALQDQCEIRRLEIQRPYWTYCANHPHRSPEPDQIPIGPVWTGKDIVREMWMPSPDTEEVRRHLLDIVAAIDEQPQEEYPIGVYKDEIVVWQLGEFREVRALPHLQRISNFDSSATAGEPFFRTRAKLVATAVEAVNKIRAIT